MNSDDKVPQAGVNTDMMCSYSVFRRVVGYYNDGPSGKSEDAFDMRKPLSRDKNREHVRENGENFLVNPEDVS